ncbi:hypothetical protein [Thiorhodococcus fuscus]|uniref:Uncharacterized protein n=1 Tax=Thiorhodococcus fuscus TaxID=527200 RepID=A0ABW4Y6N3_9GAMM
MAKEGCRSQRQRLGLGQASRMTRLNVPGLKEEAAFESGNIRMAKEGQRPRIITIILTPPILAGPWLICRHHFGGR